MKTRDARTESLQNLTIDLYQTYKNILCFKNVSMHTQKLLECLDIYSLPMVNFYINLLIHSDPT